MYGRVHCFVLLGYFMLKKMIDCSKKKSKQCVQVHVVNVGSHYTKKLKCVLL